MMFTSDNFGNITDNDDDFSEDIYSTDDFDSEYDTALVDNDGDGVYETLIQGFDTDDDGQIDTWAVSQDLDNDGIIDDITVVQGFEEEAPFEVNDDPDLTNPELEEPDLLTDEEDIFQEYLSDDDPDLTNPELEEPDLPTDENDNSIIGNPENYLDDWHEQTYGDTCAIASQEFILDELTDQDFSEEELRQEAIDNGWYTPGGGTPMDCMGNLLEAHGIDVEQKDSCTFDDITEQLDQGQNVIVALDSDEIWNPGGFDTDDLISDLVGMPGQDANHAVQVIGIDNSNPDNPMVILNDPGHPEGQGMMVSAEQFMDAWEDSGQYMVHTTGKTVQENESPELDFGGRDIGLLGDYYDDVAENASWGGYYDDWGDTYSYHGYHDAASTCYEYAAYYYENAV